MTQLGSSITFVVYIQSAHLSFYPSREEFATVVSITYVAFFTELGTLVFVLVEQVFCDTLLFLELLISFFSLAFFFRHFSSAFLPMNWSGALSFVKVFKLEVFI